MYEQNKNKIFGLDVLRSIAIIIVIIGHSNFILEPYCKNISTLSIIDGVDLFFVLSGFLIGNILIKIIEQEQKFNFKAVVSFLKRRWFRTLPNYFLFLIINIILICFGLIKGSLNKYVFSYFVFLQNFHKPVDFLFWESWSLAIEEWFYLTFPILMLFVFKISNYKLQKKQSLLITILVFIGFSMLYRVLNYNSELDFDLYVRKLVLTRFDIIGFGLLAAYINYYYNSIWNKYRNYFFVAGIICLIFVVKMSYATLLNQMIYFVLLGLSILLLLPKFNSLKDENIPLKPFRFISKVSYSAYLIHLPLVQLITNYYKVNTLNQTLIIYFGFWILTFSLSYIVFKFYEKPLTDLREKF